MGWIVQTQVKAEGSAIVPGGGILVQEPSLTVPTEKGIVAYGQPTCTGMAPTTGTHLVNGPCNTNQKFWLLWKKDGGTGVETATFSGVELTDGVPKAVCADTITKATTSKTQLVYHSTLLFNYLVVPNQYSFTIRSPAYQSTWGFFPPGNKTCFTIGPIAGGYLTFLPVTSPMGAK